MDASFTGEQREIRRTLRRLLRERCGPDAVRAAVRTPAGYDAELWRRLAGELGLPGLAVPAVYGGAGCGPVELAAACEETGRALLPSPLLPTAALAVPLLTELGGEAQRAAWLPRLAGGDLTATLAVPGAALGVALGLTGYGDAASGGPGERARGGTGRSVVSGVGGGPGGDALPGGSWAGGGRAGGVQARRGEGGGWVLYGEVGQVLGGHAAGLLLVAAHAGGPARGRTLLFAVAADAAPGPVRTRQTALDETRAQARIELRDVPAEPLGDPGDAPAVSSVPPVRPAPGANGAPADGAVTRALARAGALAAAALAAEAVGAADEALRRTVEHVRTREQFGRPIGSFQAVQHRLADLHVRLEAARSAASYAAHYAARSAATPGTPAPEPEVPPLALAEALDAQRAVAAQAIQLHGGIGFTWEHEAHLYFKRAASDELLFGPPHRLRAHAARLAGVLEGGGEARDPDPRDLREVVAVP